MSSSSRRSCPSISFDEIRHEDGSFPFLFDKGKVLGKGGEAIVYLACLYIGQKKTPIAVKRLIHNYSIEFESEIQTMSKIRHSNTVSLLCYCEQSGEKILIYEYMEKGSLTNYLKPKSSISLSWKQRLNICLGAARGLKYLHTETVDYPKGIVHRDVKPDNILIDGNWVGKISDFGMVKLSHAGQQKSMMTTDIKGTKGYYAPEYFMTHSVTRKIDIYAFGVVLFQILCLKSPWDRGDESYYRRGDEDLGRYALQNIDTRIKQEISDDSLIVFTDIIQRSLQMDPNKRPDMDTVVLNLEKALKSQNLQDEPLDSAVLSRLKLFSAMNKLKQMALCVIVVTLSEEEIGGLKELFKMIDTDNSGSITFEELKVGLERAGSQLWESDIKYLMDAVDIDNSGTIDFGEFLAATVHLNVLEREENLVSAFSFFDKDGSGYITIDELQQACIEFGLGEVHLDEMVKEIDQDNDGQIDYAEFAAMMRKGNIGGGGGIGRRTMMRSNFNLGEAQNLQDESPDSAVLSRLKQFSAMNKLKKMALRVIVETLSEEEIGGLKELFKVIDTENSGTITFEELKIGLERAGSQLWESEIKYLMDAVDINDSGTIDYVEFLAATVHLNVLEREENLVSAFSYFDKDGSGYITVDELQQACIEFGLGEVHLDEMIKEIDQDNDGQIDYAEFAAMMRKGNVGGGIGRRTMMRSKSQSGRSSWIRRE